MRAGIVSLAALYLLSGIVAAGAASTMMARSDGAEHAGRHTQALAATARWRVLGTQLEPYDADGRLLARLEASGTP